MRIGIVCEGPTDFPAIVYFVGNELRRRGINCEFVSLFPELDRTRPIGGWASVLMWFEKYHPALRIQRFFGGGLFGGGLAQQPLDAMIIHLDADVIGDASFQKFVLDKFGLQSAMHRSVADRSQYMTFVIQAAARLHELTDVDREKHVAFPAVEATEAWCVAAYHNVPVNAEILAGADLTTAFMRVLEASESKDPEPSYANVDKNAKRRTEFCQRHASNSNRVYGDCSVFAASVDSLINVAV